MHLALPTRGLEAYTSPSQRARVATEAWGENFLYCANCSSDELFLQPRNTPTVDFTCKKCDSLFQLKSRRQAFKYKINDASHSKMIEAVDAGKFPNLFVLQYDFPTWRVQNLVLVPHFAFSRSAIQCRKPLSPQAERAGWVGCNIVLANIPEDARIQVISGGIPSSKEGVRRQFRKLKPLSDEKIEDRGWTLDVLNIVRSLGKREFKLAEVYEGESVLLRLHPHNRHIQPKIRQQLQVLRDIGLIEFLGPGHYRLR